MSNLPVEIKKEETGKKPVESTKDRTTVAPAVDIYEKKDELVMLVDMAGVSKENVEIKVDNGMISISGQSDVPKEGDIRYWEFCPCDYYRAFELGPEIDQEKIHAELKHGVMTVHLPKLEKAKPKQITVNVK